MKKKIYAVCVSSALLNYNDFMFNECYNVFLHHVYIYIYQLYCGSGLIKSCSIHTLHLHTCMSDWGT